MPRRASNHSRYAAVPVCAVVIGVVLGLGYALVGCSSRPAYRWNDMCDPSQASLVILEAQVTVRAKKNTLGKILEVVDFLAREPGNPRIEVKGGHLVCTNDGRLHPGYRLRNWLLFPDLPPGLYRIHNLWGCSSVEGSRLAKEFDCDDSNSDCSGATVVFRCVLEGSGVDLKVIDVPAGTAVDAGQLTITGYYDSPRRNRVIPGLYPGGCGRNTLAEIAMHGLTGVQLREPAAATDIFGILARTLDHPAWRDQLRRQAAGEARIPPGR